MHLDLHFTFSIPSRKQGFYSRFKSVTQVCFQPLTVHLGLNVAEISLILSSDHFQSQSQCDEFLGLSLICSTVLLVANQGTVI